MVLEGSDTRNDGPEGGFGLTEPNEISERDVYVSYVLAEEWIIDDSGEFSLRADIGDVVEQHGSGVYTISIVATVAGELSPISVYSVFVNW